MKVVAASGGFDPLHVGHVEYLQHAKSLGDKLVVIVNTDDFLIRKKGMAFMPLKERMAIVAALKCVDEVIACIDQDQSVCETLRMLKPNIFAKGGDRHSGNIPETPVCQECNIDIMDGLGAKIQSSSDLVKKANEHTIKSKQPQQIVYRPNSVCNCPRCCSCLTCEWENGLAIGFIMGVVITTICVGLAFTMTFFTR